MLVFGIDTSGGVSEALNTEAIPLIGGAPKFWGRYFNGTSSTLYQYDASENLALAELGIPLLCFARQMAHVTETTNARAHAQNNMKGVIDAFGAVYLKGLNVSPIMYLDLEPEEDHPEHVMPREYYENWSAEISAGITAGGITIKFRPAIYLNRGDNQQSWLNVNAACVGGSICVGASVARYVHQDRPDDQEIAPPLPPGSMTWDANTVTPRPVPIPHGQPNANIPVIVWQYYGDYPKTRGADHKVHGGDIDLELVNPAYKNLVMSGVIPAPPVSSAGANTGV